MKKTERKASSCVTLDKTFPLSESRFPPLEKGTNHIYLLWGLVVMFEKFSGSVWHPGAASWYWCSAMGRCICNGLWQAEKQGAWSVLRWPGRPRSLQVCFGTGTTFIWWEPQVCGGEQKERRLDFGEWGCFPYKSLYVWRSAALERTCMCVSRSVVSNSSWPHGL